MCLSVWCDGNTGSGLIGLHVVLLCFRLWWRHLDDFVFFKFPDFFLLTFCTSAMNRSFVPPVRDEESETQRKAHAKRVRETRRSTQGVTLEEVKTAEQLAKKKQADAVSLDLILLIDFFSFSLQLIWQDYISLRRSGKLIWQLIKQIAFFMGGRLQYLRRSPPIPPSRLSRNPSWNGGHHGDYASTITIRTRLATLYGMNLRGVVRGLSIVLSFSVF